MAIDKLPDFQFQRGIETISHRQQGETNLPDAGSWLPSDVSGSAELDKLLALPHLGDYPAQQLRPDIGDKSWLTPQGFESTLHAATSGLQQRCTTDASPALASALALLQSQQQWRDLVTSYRNLLHLG